MDDDDEQEGGDEEPLESIGARGDGAGGCGEAEA